MSELDIFFVLMTIAALAASYLVRRHDRKNQKNNPK